METFVLRIWTPGPSENDNEPLGLRGLVEHVRFGEQRALVFESGDQLLTLLLHRAQRPRVRPLPHRQRLDRSSGHRLHGQQQPEELGEVRPSPRASSKEGER